MKEKFEIDVVAAIVKNSQGKILITRRPADTHLGGLWEFPGGKVEDDENHAHALVREIQEETALDIVPGALYWQETVDYGWKIVHLFFYECQLKNEAQQIRLQQISDYRWLDAAQLPAFEFPRADTALIRHLSA